MHASTVVIAAGERSIEAVLAAEALRRAARQRGLELMIEIRSDQGVTGALPASDAASATQLLLVGDGEADIARFGNARIVHATLGEVLDDPVAALAPLAAAPASVPATGAGKRIVAVTSCPTGIAHTFMAAEGLQQAAKALGHAIRVETQGSVGAQDALSDAEIAAADVVLIAADREVDLARFAGKRLFKSGTKPAINDGQNLIRKALAEVGVHAGTAASGRTAEKNKSTGPYKHLMTGVSFMLPFVTAGGLLIALAFALGGIYAFDDAHKGTLAWSLFQIGAKSGFMLMVPALAGYIAYSIADRPGIAPGMIGGLVALLGVVLMLRGWARRGNEAGAAAELEPVTPLLNRRIVITMLLALAYAGLLIGRAPFWLVTALFVAAFVAVFAPSGSTPLRRATVAVLAGVLTSAVVTLVFEQVFLVRLP